MHQAMGSAMKCHPNKIIADHDAAQIDQVIRLLQSS